MTVTYTAEVATCRKFGCFIKLLARWKGSIYKLIWMDLLLFLALYYCINLVYIYWLNDDSKRTFESIVYYCASYTSLIPLSFVLGFYVNLVMTRWWEQYTTIPWPDSIAVFVSAHVQGQDEGSRVMRRTVMRYVCVCLTIVFSMISPCVKKRFPKLKNLVDAGLLLENEKDIIESMDLSFPKYPKHWLPIIWAASIITRARKEGRIRDDFAVKTIIDELNTFRGRCSCLMYYDFISIPLVYTQVVTIAVYSFFVCSLLAHQLTDMKKDTYERLDFYLPVFITLQFFFYMGWLKVAETLINPFGEDDDDFEVNWMIDRHLQVSYLIVDEMHHEHPELVKDQYWDEVYPNELPYDAETKREQPPRPSTAKYDQEDMPRQSLAKVDSSNNSIKSNVKTRFSIQSIISSRSQRFSEALQHFSPYSDEVMTDVEASIPSTTVSEKLQRVTSYTSSDVADSAVVPPSESRKMWSSFRLETVSEEGEETYLEEVDKEEELLPEEEIEVEKNEVQTSFESDSDSDDDLFERLRIERLQQRHQRLNDYLERNFGPIFQIVPPAMVSNENPSKNTLKEVKLPNEEKLLEKTLKDLEEEKSLQKMFAEFKQNPTADLQKIEILSNEKLNQEKDITTNNLITVSTPSQTPSGFLSTVSISKTSAETSSLTDLRSEPLSKAITKSVGNSPLASARSVLTESSSEIDEWELLSTHSTSSAKDLKIDIYKGQFQKKRTFCVPELYTTISE